MRTLLIAGFGDVVRRPEQADTARQMGVQPIRPTLTTSRASSAWLDWPTPCSIPPPPPEHGERDPRLSKLLGILAKAGRLQRVVYISTSGVYAGVEGRWVNEMVTLRLQSSRAKRRVDAEQPAAYLCLSQ